MPVYHFRALNNLGQEVSGTCEASDRAAAVCLLMEQEITPVEVRKDRQISRSVMPLRLFKQVRLKDLALLCRQLSVMVNAGVSIPDSLDIVRKQGNRGLREILDSIYKEVQKGKSLSQVMRMHGEVFPRLLVNMVEAGEASGALGQVLDIMAVHYEKEYKTVAKVKNALIYPVFVGAAAVMVVVIMVVYVLPVYVALFQQAGLILPVSTRMLIRGSSFIEKYSTGITAIIIGLTAGCVMVARTGGGKRYSDGMKIVFPVLGSAYTKLITARFSRTLGVLTGNGISLLKGMDIAKRVIDNLVIEGYLTEVQKDIEKGRGLSEALEQIRFFPPMMIQMVRIGENSGTLDNVLERTADFYDGEVEDAVARLAALFEPVLIILMAAVVAFIVISIVLPMMDIITAGAL